MSKTTPEGRTVYYDLLENSRAVMLGADGAGPFMQPMTPQFEENVDGSDVWFFTKTDTGLARASKDVADARMCLVGDNGKSHACVTGELSVERDDETIDKFWSPVVAAWFDDGKADPKLTMLRFIPDKAAIWVSDAGAAKFGFEIARANLGNTTPNLGFHEIVQL